ncbi:MAG TPA: hypothetical protein VFJ16_32130 [Longimicrobium sp.]|nr:hypothetical protein [Longimicrobium sp.]
MKRAAVLALALIVPAAARAQAPEYRRAPGDTLVYREVTSATVEMRPASGTITVKTGHDARIAVTFGAADTARAWFQALSLSAEGAPLGTRRPDSKALLGQPYTLIFGARGQVQTVAVPPIPPEVAQVTDLSAEFTDFFPRLPPGPFQPGATWADTTRHQTTNAAGRTVIAERLGAYRVRGDSAIHGERVVVVEMTTHTEIFTGSANVPQPNVPATESALAGEETGTFYFAPASGRLVARRRSGSMAGAVTITAAGQQLSIPQSFTYESRIDLVR